MLSRPAPEPSLTLADCDVYLTWPLVVLIHGGFWRPEYDRIHLRPMASALRDAGWNVLSLEYQREPGNPDATIDDIRAALGRVHDDAIVMGHSAGGHLALWAASALGLRAVALAPVADLQLAQDLDLDTGAVRDFLGVPAARRPDLDPARMPPGRVVLIHGERDTIVPMGLSAAYVAAHPSARLVTLPEAAHFELIDPRANAWPVVIHELQRLLA